MFEDEKKAFDALDEELRKMNRHDQEDDLADILALLDKDYTKPQEPAPREPEPAPRKKERKPAASGHESRETRELSRELLEAEEPAPAKKRRGLIPLAIVALLELAGIAAVVVWWLQWLS